MPRAIRPPKVVLSVLVGPRRQTKHQGRSRRFLVVMAILLSLAVWWSIDNVNPSVFYDLGSLARISPWVGRYFTRGGYNNGELTLGRFGIYKEVLSDQEVPRNQLVISGSFDIIGNTLHLEPRKESGRLGVDLPEVHTAHQCYLKRGDGYRAIVPKASVVSLVNHLNSRRGWVPFLSSRFIYRDDDRFYLWRFLQPPLEPWLERHIFSGNALSTRLVWTDGGVNARIDVGEQQGLLKGMFLYSAWRGEEVIPYQVTRVYQYSSDVIQFSHSEKAEFNAGAVLTTYVTTQSR